MKKNYGEMYYFIQFEGIIHICPFCYSKFIKNYNNLNFKCNSCNKKFGIPITINEKNYKKLLRKKKIKKLLKEAK
jgi:ribosomal protein L37AE/L43A